MYINVNYNVNLIDTYLEFSVPVCAVPKILIKGEWLCLILNDFQMNNNSKIKLEMI